MSILDRVLGGAEEPSKPSLIKKRINFGHPTSHVGWLNIQHGTVFIYEPMKDTYVRTETGVMWTAERMYDSIENNYLDYKDITYADLRKATQGIYGGDLCIATKNGQDLFFGEVQKAGNSVVQINVGQIGPNFSTKALRFFEKSKVFVLESYFDK